MEYVIMGYLKSPLTISDKSFLDSKTRNGLEPGARQETYFCAINFNIRKFAIAKMIENIPGEEVE